MSIHQMQRGDQQRARNISLVESLASRMVRESGDELRRLIFADPPMTYGDIARYLFPEQCERESTIAMNAVRTAAKRILSESEQQMIQRRNIQIGFERHISTCGMTRWSTHEIDTLRRLLTDEIYPAGHGYAGIPNYERIVTILNDTFHNGNKTRTPATCRAFVNEYKNKYSLESQAHKLTPWSHAEKERLKILANDPGHRHLTGTKVGSPHWKKISQTLNREFHTRAYNKGIHVRKSSLCRTRYRQLLLEGNSLDTAFERTP